MLDGKIAAVITLLLLLLLVLTATRKGEREKMVSIHNSRVQVVIRDTKEQFYGYQEIITSPRRLFYGRCVVRSRMGRGIWKYGVQIRFCREKGKNRRIA